MLQEVIADEVSSQAANALVAIPDMMEDDAEQIFPAAIHNAQEGISSVMYDALEHVIHDQMSMAGLVQTTDKHVY